MDFLDAIPDDSKTMVVVPTLLFSESNCAKLLKDLEIRYLANRGPQSVLRFADGFCRTPTQPETAGRQCSWIRAPRACGKLNERYGSGERGPFYLLHRARRWNPQERKWMGYERKRGKLNDLNKLLLGRGNWFDTIVGDLSRSARNPLRDHAGYRHAASARHRREDGGRNGASVEPADSGPSDATP